MARPPANAPASLLRGALMTEPGKPLSPMRTTAERVIARTLRRYARVSDRAEALDVSLSTYHALAADFPELFGVRENRPGPKKKDG
jgi:hypothetical protein